VTSHRIQLHRSQKRLDGALPPTPRGRITRVPRRSARTLPLAATESNAHGSATPRTLDQLGAHWRLALFAAEDAIRAARACGRSVGLSSQELAALERRLAEERSATDRLLETVAREERLELHHRLTTPRSTTRTLGLPPEVRACLFDLDGVLTGSAEIHAAAWRESINDFLSRRFERIGERFGPLQPFSARRDYYRYLHGKPRIVGAHAFLASRGILLSEGHPDDPIDAETVFGLTNHKNEVFQRLLAQEGIHAFTGSLQYLEATREAGIKSAVLSASTNTESILERSGLAPLIDRIIDGNVIRARNLEGKPTPDTIVAACELLGIQTDEAATFETTVDGLDAGRSAGVAIAVAVDRTGRAQTLRAHGAHLVVPDLVALLNPRA
jgi:beta-phosphoglucomutase-like phosphatase (HAD superfamily)